MGRLIYALGMSLDGYVVDASGSFDWSAPDEEAHRLANEEARETAAFLFGRRMFETMEEFWTSAAARDGLPPVEAEFARAYVDTPRIVFSDSLPAAPGGVRLVRRAEARAEGERLKARTDGHLSVGGAALAASLIDLVDEFRMWVNPVAVGGGTPFFPAVPGIRRLRLLEARALSAGSLYLRYERAD
jgi:dihydrofolate reductase